LLPDIQTPLLSSNRQERGHGFHKNAKLWVSTFEKGIIGGEDGAGSPSSPPNPFLAKALGEGLCTGQQQGIFEVNLAYARAYSGG
jgi:hypothetical protein